MTLLGVAVAVALIFVLERCFPLRKPTRPLGPRLFLNGALSLGTFTVAAALVRPATVAALRWGDDRHLGVARWLELPLWGEAVLGFLLLDLSFYYWHRLNHRMPFLWRFHNVHHFDPDLDVSTGFRFHFGEVGLSAFLRAFQALALGVSPPVFAAYEVVFQIGTYLHHGNLRLPYRFEWWLNRIFVTPRMHGIHHSRRREETDSNYSVVFSFWDRLHRTVTSFGPDAGPAIGVPGYSEPADNRLGTALGAPFRRQKDYWPAQ